MADASGSDDDNKVVELDDFRPHYFFEGICLGCYRRSIIVVPEGVLYKEIECAGCREVGKVIDTGQPMWE